MRVQQSHWTSHLWVLRPRSTIRFSPTIRSVATGTQWSRPKKLRIVYAFLLSRRTEIDSGSGPSAKAKRPVVGKTHSCHITVEAVITVQATLSGRKRQVHYRLYSQLAFCDRNDEFVAPCWNTGRENLTGKTTIVLCNVLFFVVLWY